MVSPVSNFTLEGFERFRVKRRLGRGGFGEVFKAWDHQSGRHIAIKLLSQYDPQAHLQLAGEFSRVQSIRHPNLVELYELLYIRRRPVLLMEYLPDAVPFPSGVRDDIWDRDADVAMSMTTIAATRRLLIEEELRQPVSAPLPPTHQPRFFTAALGLLNGLDALHRRGLVHRDIKPSNVVLAEGRAVLLDYGLTMDDGGELIELAGTAGYIAPELLSGGRATRKCDIYSVGMLFARSLLGRLPSTKDRASGIELYAHFLAHDQHSDFFELLSRATSHVAEDRPTVSELIDVVQVAADGQSAPRSADAYHVEGQSEIVERIASSLSNNLCVLRGPIGAGKTTTVNDVLTTWSQQNEQPQVFRVDAASESFERLLSRIVHAGAERLMGFANRDEVPVRGLRISNQLATRFPVVEAALENLGMPRQLGAESTALAFVREAPLIAQWLRALYHGTAWIAVIEHVDPTDRDIVGFLATLFQQGEFPQCSGALVTSTFHLDELDDLPNAISFECLPLAHVEVEELVRSSYLSSDEEQITRAAEQLRSLTRGFRQPLGELLAHMPNCGCERVVRGEAKIVDVIREALASIIGSLTPEGVAALWVICAARSLVRPKWLHIICSPDESIDVTLKHLSALHLVDRALFDDGTIGYVPYSPALSRVFLEFVSASAFQTSVSIARLEALENTSISGTHLVARLYAEIGSDEAASRAYRRCLRLLFRSHRYDESLKVCEEFMGRENLTVIDFKAIASVYIHCRRPLDASAHMQKKEALSDDSELIQLSRRIRWQAGDHRQKLDGESGTSLTAKEPSRRIKTGLLSIRDIYRDVRDALITRPLPHERSPCADFTDVHPSIKGAYQLYRESKWRRCLEATTADRWVELDDPAELISLLRLYDYMIARSQFFINRPLSEQTTVFPPGSQTLGGNHRFQTAVSYLNVGWLIGLQEGSVLDVVRRVEQCGEILDEFGSGPDLRRLLDEARSAKRILQGKTQASEIIPWPKFASELVTENLSDFFDALEVADERRAREILKHGFRMSYHGGSKLIAMVLLMLFGQFTEERLFAEESLQASGWQIPDVAACLLFGVSREELRGLRSEISAVEGIQLPSKTTADIRSFVGAGRPRS